MTPRVLALIPAHNEADRIGAVVTQARPLVDDVVVIDDGSDDETAAVAEKAGAKLLRHEKNRGKGGAIATALDYFKQSGAAFAVLLDADGQHDPSEITKFLETANREQADIVIGTRMGDTGDMPFVRRVTNRFTSWVTSQLAGQRIPDSQCGYRLLRREVLKDLRLSTARFETETEMLVQAARAGHRVVSIPIRTIYESGHTSHIHPFRDTIRFFTFVRRYWKA